MSIAGYRIVLALNQPLAEAGIVNVLSENDEYTVVAQVSSIDTIMPTISASGAHLLITDYNSPGFISLEHLREIILTTAGLNVLVISSDENKNSIMSCVQLGIKGYLTKECGREEFLHAVQSTCKGDKFFCSRILDIILERQIPETEVESSVLTTRETEILKLLATGNSTQGIADRLHLSPHTIQTHRKSIIRKLKIKSPTQFVIHALEMGLITQK